MTEYVSPFCSLYHRSRAAAASHGGQNEKRVDRLRHALGLIAQRCVDANGDRNGSRVLHDGINKGDEPLFEAIERECLLGESLATCVCFAMADMHLVVKRTFQLENRIEGQDSWGRNELKMLIEHKLASNTSMHLNVQVCLSGICACVTGARWYYDGWYQAEKGPCWDWEDRVRF